LDGSRAALFAWTTDGDGVPVAGVAASPIVGATGPYYDGLDPNALDPVAPTRRHGLVALFDLSPPSVMLRLEPPANAPVRDDAFELPVRTGAVTTSIVVLPPR
jgi:hypothetical protein